MSLWVDDLTISGRYIPGQLLKEIRRIVARAGLKSHKIRYRSGARPVSITGIPISRAGPMAPRGLHQRIQDGYLLLRAASTDAERDNAIALLLSQLGSLRYHIGKDTPLGRKTADRMNALRRRRADLEVVAVTMPEATATSADETPCLAGGALPWE